MTAACAPNLPQGLVRTVVCGDHPVVRRALEASGAEVLVAETSRLLPEPVADHADMLCCHAGRNALVTADVSLAGKLGGRGVRCVVPERPPAGCYPYDVALNCLVIGRFAFGRQDSAAPEVLGLLNEQGIEFVSVRQGYARCSVAVVDDRSAITADRGIYNAMTAAGFEVLLISPGGIILEGYDTGFIGGCCGKLSADRMLFCGNPHRHPDGERIIDFLSQRGVRAECTHDGALVDFGGFIGIFE